MVTKRDSESCSEGKMKNLLSVLNGSGAVANA